VSVCVIWTLVKLIYCLKTGSLVLMILGNEVSLGLLIGVLLMRSSVVDTSPQDAHCALQELELKTKVTK